MYIAVALVFILINYGLGKLAEYVQRLLSRAKRTAAVQWQRLRPALIRLREAVRLALARARRLGRRLRERWAALGR